MFVDLSSFPIPAGAPLNDQRNLLSSSTVATLCEHAQKNIILLSHWSSCLMKHISFVSEGRQHSFVHGSDIQSKYVRNKKRPSCRITSCGGSRKRVPMLTLPSKLTLLPVHLARLEALNSFTLDVL